MMLTTHDTNALWSFQHGPWSVELFGDGPWNVLVMCDGQPLAHESSDEFEVAERAARRICLRILDSDWASRRVAEVRANQQAAWRLEARMWLLLAITGGLLAWVLIR